MQGHLQTVLMLAVLLGASELAWADYANGVGGFVTAAPAFAAALEAHGSPKLDLSSVVVDLLTPQGVKKAQGDCSPNGYFFVPAHQGAFTVRVRGPPGWTFEPAAAQVTCTSSGCNNDEDVNFQLVGLAPSVRVMLGRSAASCRASEAAAGPSGVVVQLYKQGAHEGSEQLATSTSKNGVVSFPHVLPGQYELRALRSGWALQPERMAVAVALGATAAPQPFVVSGYRVTGAVTSKAGPVPGIRVTLHSNELDAAGCSGAASTADSTFVKHSKHGSALCAATTDDSGVFEFQGVLCGRYGLVAVHPDPASTFEISPKEVEVSVGREEAKLAAPFTITGFSVEGRVLDGAGQGVEGARVVTDTGASAVTDATGRYVLARMQEGRCNVAASKQGYEFQEQRGVEVSPVVNSLPDFVAASVAVCGSVAMSDGRFPAKRGVTAHHLKGPDGGASDEVAVAADQDGAFCMLLGRGSYRIAPVLAADEKAKGLVFSPGHVDVEVAGAPLSGVMFSQGELSIYGSIQCLESPCPPGVTLTLTPQADGGRGAGGARPRTVQLSEAMQQEQTNAGFTKFHIPGVVPGTYKLSAARPGWCWQQDHTTVTVTTTDVAAAPLSQEGHELAMVLSHDAVLAITGPDGHTALQEVPAGRAAICLPGSGEFVVVPRACHVFGREPFNLVTGALPQPLVLTATKALVQGAIKVTGDTVPDSISIKVTPPSPDGEAYTVEASPDEAGLYSYTVALPVGSSLHLEPHAPGLLFYPAARTVEHIDRGHGCQPPVAVIEARQGLQLRGTTEPPIEGAQVVVRLKQPPKAAGTGAAGEVAASSTTDAHGAFSVGPLFDYAEYSLELSKPGVEFSQKSGAPSYVFSTKKLAQVHVSVVLPDDAPRAAAFVSLSGERGFKSNAKLGEDGDHTFFGLRPGTYYLRPLLREYQFEPALAEVPLAEGEDATVAFTAKRVAWGVSGAVTSVNGNPLAGVLVEAVAAGSGDDAAPETAVTDADGHYRVQGLSPGNSYVVRVQLDGRVSSAWPMERDVPLGTADVTGVSFVAFRSSARASITGALRLPDELLGADGMRLELRPAEGSAADAKQLRPDGAGFFQLGDVKPGQYLLRLSCAGGGCSGWERLVAAGQGDVDLGELPVQVATKSARAVGDEEGRSWWPQLLGAAMLAALAMLQKDAVVDILQLDSGSWRSAGAAAGGGAGNGADSAADAASEWLKEAQSLKESQSLKKRLSAVSRRA